MTKEIRRDLLSSFAFCVSFVISHSSFKGLEPRPKYKPPARSSNHAGGKGEQRLLLFLACGGGGLRFLRLGHALLEFVHATSGIHKLLGAGVEGMAGIANA